MLQQFIDKICVAFEGWSEKQVAKFDWLDEIANRKLNEPEQAPRKPGPVPGLKKQQRELADMHSALEAALIANGRGYQLVPVPVPDFAPPSPTPPTPPLSPTSDIQEIIRRNQQRIMRQRQQGISDDAMKFLNGDDV